MRISGRNRQVLAGVEAVYGVAEALTGANAVVCDFDITLMQATPKERAFSRPYFGARPFILNEIHRAIKMSNIELAGSGDPAVAPAWTPIMRGCGWAAVTTATETTFTPVTDVVDSLTLDPILDTEQFQMIGARGSVSFMFEIGEYPKIEANILGGWVDPETLGVVPDPDYSAWQIPRSINCENTQAIMIDGVAYPFYTLKVDQNNETDFYCVPGEAGYRVEVDNREVKGTVQLQAKRISTHDLFSMVKSNSRVPLSMLHGTAPGEKVSVAGPKVQLSNPREGKYKGDLTYELDMTWCPDTGDDEIAIVTP